MYRWLLSILLTAALVLTGCAPKHKASQKEMYAQGYADQHQLMAYEYEESMPLPESAMMNQGAVGAMGARGSGMGGGAFGTKGRSGSENTYGASNVAGNYAMVPNRAKTAKKGDKNEEQAVQPKTIHYNGYANLRVSRVEETADALSALATEVGGHVEALNPRRVSIRVPVETFREVFQKVLDMGDVLDKSISAADISESLTSVKLRLDTARATRDRLVKLLAKAEDEAEKLELIRQIQRLTEEIDRLSGQSQTLNNLASFSRITVELVPREALTNRHSGVDIAELRWIRSLSPFRTDVGADGDRLALDVPEGFVELDRKGQFIVESADGARLWTGRLENQPRGDSAFWLSAVQERLADEFGSAEVTEVGGFKMLRLIDRADEPYTYIVGVRENGKHLELVEIFYPSTEHEERHAPAIDAIFNGGNS